MMQRVDEEVSERLQAAWSRGSHATQVMQAECDQSFASAVESLREVQGVQQSFEAEHEQLRQLIGALAGRLSQLGTPASPRPWAFANPDATTAPFAPPPMNAGSVGQPADAMEDLWLAATGGEDLANVPTFPPAQPPRQVPPIASKVSLADVLGISGPAPPDTPSTARSATASEASAGGSSGWEEVDAFVFSLTLRLADDVELGLSTSQAGHDRHLRIEGVLPGGAAEAWNRQCGSSGSVEKVLLPGDKIVGVNAVAGDPQAMLLECGSKQLLRLQVVRVGCSAPPSPRQAGPASVEAPVAVGLPGGRAAAVTGGKVTWRV